MEYFKNRNLVTALHVKVSFIIITTIKYNSANDYYIYRLMHNMS